MTVTATDKPESQPERQSTEINGVNNDFPLDITRALFGEQPSTNGVSPTPENLPAAENGGETPEGEPEPGDNEPENAEPDGGNETPGSAGDGETWEFEGVDYTEEQLGEALQHSKLYQNYNQSMQPLIENIRNFTEVANRSMDMAVTETEKQIAELNAFLKSGKADARQHQSAHQQLMQAEARMIQLKDAAATTEKQRKDALNLARTQNARHVSTELARAGWQKEDFVSAEGLARTIMNAEQFADVVSPGLMQMLRDAASFRASQAKAAELLKQKTKGVITNGKVKQAPAAKPKSQDQGSEDWITKRFWK